MSSEQTEFIAFDNLDSENQFTIKKGTRGVWRARASTSRDFT
jgi:hypothetical protein